MYSLLVHQNNIRTWIAEKTKTYLKRQTRAISIYLTFFFSSQCNEIQP